MAPDKIYLHEICAEELTENLPYHVCYIRKDALLEWAKKRYNEYKQMDEDFQGDVFIGNRHAFAEVIAKIESL